MKSLRILVADDHDIMRRGVRTLLESHPEWSICAEACTGNEAVAKSEELKPDNEPRAPEFPWPEKP